MRKTVSSDYDVFAIAAGKTIHWKVSIKKVSVLNEVQSAGTWIDVTPYLDKSVPEKISDTVELGFGQFKSPSLKFKGYDIAWWKANIFDAADSLEMKIEFWLNNLTADTITPFGGWLDKKKGQFVVKFTESTDSVEFNVNGYQELGSRMSAMTLTAQPTSEGGKLILQNIPGVFVSDANIASFVLKKGVHIVTYQFTGGVAQAMLDGGEPVAMPGSDGTIVLINSDGDQKLELWVDVSSLTYGAVDLTQDVIVLTAGGTLPLVWMQRVWVYTLLKSLWSIIGLTDITFDNFQLNTYDGRWTTSYFHVPPDNVYYQKPQCVKYDQSLNTIWMGIGDKIYKKDPITHTYTYIGQAASGYKIVRIFTEQSANNKVWGLAKNSSYAYKIFRITPSTGALSSWSLTNRGNGDTSSKGCLNFALANNYGSSGVLFYCSSSGDDELWYFDLNSLAEVDTGWLCGNAAQYVLAGWSDGTNYFYQEYAAIGKVRIYKLEDLGGGMWFSSGVLSGTQIDEIEDGAYNAAEAKYIHTKIGGVGVYSYNHTADSLATINASNGAGNFEYTGNKVYLTRFFGSNAPKMAYVYLSSLTEYPEAVIYPFYLDGIVTPSGTTYDTSLGRYYGLFNSSCILFQFASSITMFTEVEIDCEGVTVFDEIKELCLGYNLRPQVTAIKKVYALRRADDDGNVVTSENSVTLNADNAKDLSEETGYGEAYDIVEVQNLTDKESYDGSTFDAVAMLGETVKTINNRFIPTRLLKDYAVYFYQYFKDIHTRYVNPTPLIPYFQYEPMDGADLDFSGKIQASKSGIIGGQSMSRDGTTEFEVITTESEVVV